MTYHDLNRSIIAPLYEAQYIAITAITQLENETAMSSHIILKTGEQEEGQKETQRETREISS